MKTTDKDIGFLRKLLLKALTFLQEATIKQGNDDFYYLFTRMHFKLYFKSDLALEAKDVRKAANRHAKMVVTLLYPNSKNKKYIYDTAFNTFLKNLAMETPLERVY